MSLVEKYLIFHEFIFFFFLQKIQIILYKIIKRNILINYT